MNKKHLRPEIKGNHIIVFYKEKQLFKVSNSSHNATNLLNIINK